ncbi:MAG TPA: chloride channel protein [Allosphingosinicella sp.]|nr:chloride channel protein [Allosphingosinicella sp.]
MRQMAILSAAARLRRWLRSSEAALIGVAVAVGLLAGATMLIQRDAAHFVQAVLYGTDISRLSALTSIAPWRLLALPIGGLFLMGLNLLVRKRVHAPIDVVEANALHGGVIPIGDTWLVAAQTLLSNGFGASVGLEAAYAQMGGGLASVLGQRLKLRRSDLRLMVGAGAGAAVGAAFGAPLTGAFYAFEIVIGAYTPAAIAPVAAAAMVAALVVRATGTPSYLIAIPGAQAIVTLDYLIYALLGLICAGIAILLMQGVTWIERGIKKSPVPERIRPVVGGLLLIPIAWISPQALSAGHGALHLDLTEQVGIGFLAAVFLLKMAASAISLGFGFRGGLFFASLFLGSLVGQIYGELAAGIPGIPPIDATDAALVGMAALAVAVVGGPMTMAMLVLETTHDFALTGAALVAALCASTVVRTTFGFSFSTWRLHTRGETIRSARDVGWVKTLTAGRMMRRGVPTVPSGTTVAEFRRRFPLGSTGRVVLVDEHEAYAGLVPTAAAFADSLDEAAPVSTIAILPDAALRPDQDVTAVMRVLDEKEADDLAVVDDEARVLGTVSERHVRRRYAEEIEKAQRDLFGEA